MVPEELPSDYWGETKELVVEICRNKFLLSSLVNIQGVDLNWTGQITWTQSIKKHRADYGALLKTFWTLW